MFCNGAFRGLAASRCTRFSFALGVSSIVKNFDAFV
jgi:hypothetical protein